MNNGHVHTALAVYKYKPIVDSVYSGEAESCVHVMQSERDELAARARSDGEF